MIKTCTDTGKPYIDLGDIVPSESTTFTVMTFVGLIVFVALIG